MVSLSSHAKRQQRCRVSKGGPGTENCKRRQTSRRTRRTTGDAKHPGCFQGQAGVPCKDRAHHRRAQHSTSTSLWMGRISIRDAYQRGGAHDHETFHTSMWDLFFFYLFLYNENFSSLQTITGSEGSRAVWNAHRSSMEALCVDVSYCAQFYTYSDAFSTTLKQQVACTTPCERLVSVYSCFVSFYFKATTCDVQLQCHRCVLMKVIVCSSTPTLMPFYFSKLVPQDKQFKWYLFFSHLFSILKQYLHNAMSTVLPFK